MRRQEKCDIGEEVKEKRKLKWRRNTGKLAKGVEREREKVNRDRDCGEN